MKLGLDTLAGSVRPGQRRVAVLGGMGELGDESPKYHQEIGDYARSRCDVLIGISELAKHYTPDHWFADSDACAGAIDSLLRSGDCIFLKGSSSVRMIKVVSKLREQTNAVA